MNYEQYFELAERHGWRVSDFDWAQLVAEDKDGLVSDLDKQSLLGTAVIEQGVPHYSEVWSLVQGLRDHWELWQFATLWTGEEHRHSYALKKACDTLGITGQIAGDLSAVAHFPFAQAQKKSCDDDCYKSVPGMLTYATIQELATFMFYMMVAKQSKSPFVKELLSKIAGDEMRHHVFYRDTLKELYATATDQVWYSDQVYRAIQAFKMPHLIYDLQVPFFEAPDWVISTELRPQLARCFAFDPQLIGRLMQAYQVDRSGRPADQRV